MSGSTPNNLAGITGQLVFFGLFVAVLMVFSNSPRYEHFPPGQALLKVSISHAGQIKGECHKRSAEELAKLSPNMRVTESCPRERSDILLELSMDDKLLFRGKLPPSGIQRDGFASIYHRYPMSSGKHRLVARMKDHEKLTEYNYVKQMDINLAPAQVFVIDFDEKAGGFIFH